MVGMYLVVTPRVIGEDDVRPVLADDAAHLATQIHADLELAILMAEENKFLDPDRFAGRTLLPLSRFGHLLGRRLQIVRALLAARDHAIRHVSASGLDPRRQGA